MRTRLAPSFGALLVWLCLGTVHCRATANAAPRPELIVQTGHSGTASALALSHDGQWLASASADHSVRLWDIRSGREVRSLRGHPQEVNAVAWSRDDKLLATGGNDGVIRLWDPWTGRLLVTLEGHKGFVMALAFGPDGQSLASVGTDKTIRLWSHPSGRLLRSVEGLAESADTLAWSLDGRMLATGGVDRVVRLWDTTTWREQRALRGGKGAVSTVAFSPDGRTLAFGSDDTQDSDTPGASTVHVYELPSGRALRTLKAGTPYVFAVAFSPDSRTLAGANEGPAVLLWDVATGRLLRPLAGHTDAVKSLLYMADGRLVSGGFEGQIRIWDVAAGRTQQVLAGDTSPVNAIALSEDSKLLASANEDHSISLWRLAETQQPQRLTGHSNVATAVAFSPDGKSLATGSLDGEVRVWRTDDGRQISAFTARHGPEGQALALIFSPDGRMLITSAFRVDTLQLWEVASGRAVRTLKLSGQADGQLAFSTDGGILAAAEGDGVIELWDLQRGGAPRRLLPAEPSATLAVQARGSSSQRSLSFSPDGRTLATGHAGGIDLWDVASGRLTRALVRGQALGERGTQAFRPNAIWPVAFSRDGRLVAGGADDGTIAYWDLAGGQSLRTVKGHGSNVTALRFAAGARVLVSAGDDATLRLWDAATGQELAQLVATGAAEGLVVAPDGLFDGAAGAWQKILWRFSPALSDVAPVEIFFNEFFYPNLLADLLDGKRPRAGRDLAQRDRRQPDVRLSVSGANDGQAAAREVAVRISVSDTGGGARDVRLFRNGSLVKNWRGDVPSKEKNAELEARVTLVAGANRLTAYAFNRDNVKSRDGSLAVEGADSLRRTATLHVLAVGINQYANHAFDLSFAVADAQAVASEMQRQQERLKQFARVETKLLLDESATKPRLLEALRQLAQVVQPEDAVLLFFAGHGLADEPRFYLIPHDLGYEGPRTPEALSAGLREVFAHGVSDEELERALEPLDAAQILLIIDACNSGQALEATERRRGPMNSRGLAQLAWEKGMFILTAAQSYQAALEAAQYGHGLLTYTLVEEGLKQGRADRDPADGQILGREWFDYATRRVPQMQLEEMQRARGLGKRLAIVEGEEKISEVERRSLQRPRAFYRRDSELAPLVIGRGGNGGADAR